MEEELSNILKTKIIGKNILFYDTLESTQLKAKEIKNTAKDGTIIITSNQISGIGTHDRKWYMGSGDNIAFTMILKPRCNISKIKNITTVIAECMVKAINNLYNIQINIKLPNDLVYNGKKLGGILTQATTIQEDVKDILIGIGMNINQKDFPIELKNIATSLKNEFNMKFSRIEIIAEFLNIFEKEYLKIII